MSELTLRIFHLVLLVAMARSSSGGIAIRYVYTCSLWMTSCFPTMGPDNNVILSFPIYASCGRRHDVGQLPKVWYHFLAKLTIRHMYAYCSMNRNTTGINFYWFPNSHNTVHNVAPQHGERIVITDCLASLFKAYYCFVLFFIHPQSKGWPHHERTFLARSANLPTGLYILLALISFFSFF